MIDFRFLIITIVAVFLALTIGIMVGSGFIGAPLTRNLENSVISVRDRNNELRDEVNALDDRLDALQQFVERLEPYAVANALEGRQVVLFTFDRTSQDMIGGINDSVEMAGGEILTTVSFSDNLVLQDQAQRDELGLILASTADDARQLRAEAAAELGARAAAAGVTSPDPGEQASLRSLLDDLEGAGYLSVERLVEEETVPPGALFLVAGGSGDEPPFEVAGFSSALGLALTERDGDSMVAESSADTWGLVQRVRDSGEASAAVSTVAQADTIQGRIAIVLALNKPSTEPARHLLGPDGAVLPDPLP